MAAHRWSQICAACVFATSCAGSTTGNGLSTLSATPQAAADAGDAIPTGALPARAGNPFLGASFYIDPGYVEEVESLAGSMAEAAGAARVRKVKAFPTAVWLSSIADVKNVEPTLARAQKQALHSASRWSPPSCSSIFRIATAPPRRPRES